MPLDLERDAIWASSPQTCRHDVEPLHRSARLIVPASHEDRAYNGKDEAEQAQNAVMARGTDDLAREQAAERDADRVGKEMQPSRSGGSGADDTEVEWSEEGGRDIVGSRARSGAGDELWLTCCR